jgi:hypothetical protein
VGGTKENIGKAAATTSGDSVVIGKTMTQLEGDKYNEFRSSILEAAKVLKQQAARNNNHDLDRVNTDDGVIDNLEYSLLEEYAFKKKREANPSAIGTGDTTIDTDGLKAIADLVPTSDAATPAPTTGITQERLGELLKDLREGQWALTKDGAKGFDGKGPQTDAERKAVLEYLTKRAMLVAELYPDIKIAEVDPKNTTPAQLTDIYDSIRKSKWYNQSGSVVEAGEKKIQGTIGLRTMYLVDRMLEDHRTEIEKQTDQMKKSLLSTPNFEALKTNLGAKLNASADIASSNEIPLSVPNAASQVIIAKINLNDQEDGRELTQAEIIEAKRLINTMRQPSSQLTVNGNVEDTEFMKDLNSNGSFGLKKDGTLYRRKIGVDGIEDITADEVIAEETKPTLKLLKILRAYVQSDPELVQRYQASLSNAA